MHIYTDKGTRTDAYADCSNAQCDVPNIVYSSQYTAETHATSTQHYTVRYDLHEMC